MENGLFWDFIVDSRSYNHQHQISQLEKGKINGPFGISMEVKTGDIDETILLANILLEKITRKLTPM